MNDSLRIGSVFGITIRVHVLFLVMVVALVAWAPSPGLQLAFISMLFLLVFLHELGHSLVAQAFGIRVMDITFWPLGGMARMSDIPEEPRVEGLIALAGPAVNFVLAAAGLVLWAGLRGLDGASSMSMAELAGSPLSLFVVMNLALGGFNLVPAFPMDGGRVLRAFLARKRNWLQATEMAVRVGRWVALAMVFWSIAYGNCMLLLIAAFIYVVGSRELAVVRLRHLGSPFGFPGMAGMGGEAGGPFQGSFTGGSFSANNLQGLFDELRRRQAGQAGDWAEPVEPDASGPTAPPSEGPRRPTVVDVERPQKRGFSEDDVKRLEGFQGRLRKPGSSDEPGA